MTIKELEERTGMTRANIRYYENEGLLRPARLANGYRDYSEADVSALEKIKLLRQLHMDLETIRAVQSGALPLDEQVTAPGPEELAILKEQVHEAVKSIDTELSSFEKKALLLSLRGQSYTEIATELSKTPKAVDNALVRVRRKLKRTP